MISTTLRGKLLVAMATVTLLAGCEGTGMGTKQTLGTLGGATAGAGDGFGHAIGDDGFGHQSPNVAMHDFADDALKRSRSFVFAHSTSKTRCHLLFTGYV